MDKALLIAMINGMITPNIIPNTMGSPIVNKPKAEETTTKESKTGVVDISGLDKAEVLLALWKGSHAQGMSFLGLETFDIEDARKIIAESKSMYFDYVAGHVIKCDLSGDTFNPRNYDRDNYEGAAEDVIDALRRGENIKETTPQQDATRCLLDMLKASYDAQHENE